MLGLEVFLCCVGSRGVPVLGLEVYLWSVGSAGAPSGIG